MNNLHNITCYEFIRMGGCSSFLAIPRVQRWQVGHCRTCEMNVKVFGPEETKEEEQYQAGHKVRLDNRGSLDSCTMSLFKAQRQHLIHVNWDETE